MVTITQEQYLALANLADQVGDAQGFFESSDWDQRVTGVRLSPSEVEDGSIHATFLSGDRELTTFHVELGGYAVAEDADLLVA